MSRTWICAVFAVAGLLAGCSSSSQDATSPDVAVALPNAADDGQSEAAAEPSSDESVNGTAEEAPAAGPEAVIAPDNGNGNGNGDGAAGEPSVSEQQAIVQGPVFIDGLDVPVIGITSPLVGGEARPLLAWTAVEDAETYEVSLYTDSGEIYWAWSGAGTSVPVGGEPLLGPNSAGPVANPGMTWFVLAIDKFGLIVGQSPVMTIAA